MVKEKRLFEFNEDGVALDSLDQDLDNLRLKCIIATINIIGLFISFL